MELKNFISTTIYEICMGIEDAKNRVEKELENQPISPANIEGKTDHIKESKIDFNLSVTSSTESSTDTKAGIIKVIEAGIGKSSSLSHEAINKVSFSIPFYPEAIFKNNK